MKVKVAATEPIDLSDIETMISGGELDIDTEFIGGNFVGTNLITVCKDSYEIITCGLNTVTILILNIRKLESVGGINRQSTLRQSPLLILGGDRQLPQRGSTVNFHMQRQSSLLIMGGGN